MKETVSLYRFRDAFVDCGRKDNFSYEGLEALFEYLTELEDDTGNEFELDVIGLCCDYTEYESIDDFNNDYGKGYSSMNEIDETIVIPIDDESFIAMAF